MHNKLRAEFPLGNSCNQLSLLTGGHFPGFDKLSLHEKSATNHTQDRYPQVEKANAKNIDHNTDNGIFK